MSVLSTELDEIFYSVAVMPRVHSKCAFGFEKKKRKRQWLASRDHFANLCQNILY